MNIKLGELSARSKKIYFICSQKDEEMKHKQSLWALLIILVAFVVYRLVYFENNSKNGYNATTWDAFGYYMYLPGEFIYDDVRALEWLPAIDSTYHVTGGNLYQASLLENGNYTGKYLTGVAILESPFFFAGHVVAGIAGAPQDGFSWPYQYAILWGAICWALLGFVVLRKVLLRFFNDQVTAITLLLLALCSNLIQYVSVDGAMSHAFIFPMYALLLWFTIRWHEQPSFRSALGIGLVCGLAVISRPTELIMIFIPILWNTHHKEAKKIKWKQVWSHKLQLLVCLGGGLLAILPQLAYWKYSTGSFIYDVGSKWYFLNPWFRVLFGHEKGWFLYTPVAVLMVLGFFFMKNRPFRKSVLVFCLLNIWIIIAWSDWKYGASYSCRALTQSYPVFALALACFVHRSLEKKGTLLLYLAGVLMLILNVYQLNTYNQSVLENFSPFWRIFN